MLTRLHIRNFRGFADHKVVFRPTTMLVGENNAGKSTVVEALRLVSLVANRYRNLAYVEPPFDSEFPKVYRVVIPSLDYFDINFDNVIHMLGEPPAVIEAEFDNRGRIEIHLTNSGIYAALFGPDGKIVRSKTEANAVDIPEIHALPQAGPLIRDEKILSPNYVRRHLTSTLASSHFRNQLNLLYEEFEDFRALAQETWGGLKIGELVRAGGRQGETLGLLVNDGRFGAEVAWMGHGLQMWLQTIWFLARTPKSSTVILDEPDVYLHPDLQRRLARLVKQRHRQVVIATHSIELMSDAEPSEILVIRRARSESRFADSAREVQRIVDHIGSGHNISLARLHTSQRLILVEGDDFELLTRFHAKIHLKKLDSFGILPNVPVGGWGGFDYAVGSGMLLRSRTSDELSIYCIFDPDYHTAEQIADRYRDAKKHGLKLHIWSRKELENYLLEPAALARVINSRKRGQGTVTTEHLIAKIDELADGLKEEVILETAEELLKVNRRVGLLNAMATAKQLVTSRWNDRDARWAILPGKGVISRLSLWAQEQFGAPFGTAAIVRELKQGEIPQEIVDVVNAIESGDSVDALRKSYAKWQLQ